MPDAEARRAVEVSAERVSGVVGRVWDWETARRRVVCCAIVPVVVDVRVEEVWKCTVLDAGWGGMVGIWGVMECGGAPAWCGVRLR